MSDVSRWGGKGRARTLRVTGHERQRRAGGEAGDGRGEDVARQRVAVLARSEPAGAADHGWSGERRPEHVQRHLRIQDGWEGAGVNDALDAGGHPGHHLLQQVEALPLLGNGRNGTVYEHQVEELGLVLRKSVEGPPAVAQVCDRVGMRGDGGNGSVELAEAFRRQSKEDVVLAGEVAVNSRRAVLDTFGDLADGDVPVALGHEQIARRGQDAVVDGLFLAVLTFSDAHVISRTERCSIS
ncbi:MAG TPA: hypothetical protein VMW48_18050 [Vicinamibacterales bacterium]|nr:hypothetical protein [Vicinamibacterales bacterium]